MLRILVAEAESTTRTNISDTLKKQGYEVYEIAGGYTPKFLKNASFREIRPERFYSMILIITGMVPVMIFNQVLFHSYMNSVLDRSMKSMEEQAKILSNQLVMSGYMDGSTNSVNNALLDQMAATWYGRIRIVDSDFMVVKDTYARDEGMICVDSGVLKAFSGSYTEYLDRDNHSL